MRRHNRFVVELVLDGDTAPVTCSMANPGRMREILVAGARIGVTAGPPGGAHPWKARWAELHDGTVVLLDTGATNRVAGAMLQHRMIPELRNHRIVKTEVNLPATRSRVDFLLEHTGNGELLYLEVKSCTLFNRRWALFPDAVTERGRRHVEELATHGPRRSTAVLFVVHTTRCDFFLPDIHADPAFARALLLRKDDLIITAAGVQWSPNGTITAVRAPLAVPWGTLETLLPDRGMCVVLSTSSEDHGIPEQRWHATVIPMAEDLESRAAGIRKRTVAGTKELPPDLQKMRIREVVTIQDPGMESTALLRGLRRLEDAQETMDLNPGKTTGTVCFSRDPRFTRGFNETILEARRRPLDGSLGSSPG